MVVDDKEDGDQRDRSTEVNVEEQIEDEARQPNVPLSIGRPTKREMEEHCVSHWPFRSWCRHCVRGRAVSSSHRRKTAEAEEFARDRVPTISVDDCFMGDEESAAKDNPVLVVYDNQSGS